MDRRTFLKSGSALPVAAVMAGMPGLAGANTAGSSWRAFEVVTSVKVLDAEGATRVWLPTPLTRDTDYFKSLGTVWSSEGGIVNYAEDPKYGVGIVSAQRSAGDCEPGPGHDEPLCDARPIGRRQESAADCAPRRSRRAQGGPAADRAHPNRRHRARHGGGNHARTAHRRRQGEGDLRVDRREHVPRCQGARLRLGRHQDDARDRQLSAANAAT